VSLLIYCARDLMWNIGGKFELFIVVNLYCCETCGLLGVRACVLLRLVSCRRLWTKRYNFYSVSNGSLRPLLCH